MKKILRRTGRHRAEVIDENGTVIDKAFGRGNIMAMKDRHDLWDKTPAEKQDTSEVNNLE